MLNLPRRLLSVALVVAVVALAATAAVVVSPSGGRTVEAVGDTFGAGGEYHELEPTRIYDSRRAGGAHRTGPNEKFDLGILGAGGVPPSSGDVLAVVANITIAAPSQAGHVTIVPKGAAAGSSSVINFAAGQTVANSTILRPGADGEVTIELFSQGAGQAHVIVDVSGWFSKSDYDTHGARVMTVDPFRLFDSNNEGGNRGAGSWTELQIRGSGAVPNDANVVGVVVNLTGAGASEATHMSLVPHRPSGEPSTSNLNLAGGQTRASLAIVPVGDDGKIRLFNKAGSVRAVVDVVGYLQANVDPSTRAGRVIPLVSSFRAFDTRRPAFGDAPLLGGNAEDFSFDAFTKDVKISGEPVGAQSGLFGNLTTVGLRPAPGLWGPVHSHMTAYPTPDVSTSVAPPRISNLNYGEGEIVPNMALLRHGERNEIRFYNFNGQIDYLLDVYAVVLAEG